MGVIRMAVRLYKTVVKVGATEKTVVVANYKDKDKTVEITKKHHILIFDRSGSMSSTLDKLIDNMKKVISKIPYNDYITIMWFSGTSQYRTIIKGACKAQGQEQEICNLLDTVRTTVGCTCFSEVIKETGDIIKELKVICPNFIVNLFTDGEACTNKTEEEEYSLAKQEAKEFAKDILAFNTIGYGNYYNQEFLKSLSEITPYGVMCHSSNIDEYYDIILENISRLSGLTNGTLDVTANGLGGIDIMYLSNSNCIVANDTMLLNMIDSSKNQIAIFSESEFEFEINGEKFDSMDIVKAIPKTTLIPIMYGYAYGNYYRGDRKKCLDVLATTLRDKHLVDEQFKAFTFDECERYSNKIKKAIRHKASRLVDGECSDNYIPADNATCLIDVLQILIGGNSKYVYTEDYRRIGAQMIDTLDKFNESKIVPITDINGIVFNETKLNISIQSTIYGKVKLAVADSRLLGLPKVVDSKKFVNQTIVKDGNLNINKIDLVVSKNTLKDLTELGIDGLVTTPIRNIAQIKKSLSDNSLDIAIIGLDLTKIPVINRMYLDEVGEIDNVLANTLKLNELAVKQKVLNYFNKKEHASGFTLDKMKLLKETYGLNTDLVYNGIMKKPEGEPEDYYITREIEFQIKGRVTIPSISDVIKRADGGKALKGNAEIMFNYITELENEFNKINKKNSKKSTAKSKAAALSKKLQNDDVDKIKLLDCDIPNVPGLYDFLMEKLRVVKLEKLACSIEQASVKMANVLTGSWFWHLIPDENGNYSYYKDGDTLVIKTKKTRVVL